MSPVNNHKYAILVLGMHRSGTSAITRVLALLGADLPSNLISPQEDNPTGFWESEDLLRSHEDLFKSAGSAWDDISQFNLDWYQSPGVELFKRRLLHILNRDFSTSPFFVVKDPRICRFVPLWLEVIEEFGATAKVVIILRDPMEVVDSLKTRDNFVPAKSLLLWLRYNLAAERNTRSLSRSLILYDDLLQDWHKTTDRISRDLEIKWTRTSHRASIEIDQFLSSRYRHHKVAPGELEVHPEVVDWVKVVYGTLSKLSTSPKGIKAQKKLDMVERELAQASLVFEPIMRDITQGYEKMIVAKEESIGQLQRQLADQVKLGDQFEEAQKGLEATVEKKEHQVLQLQRQLADRKRHVNQLNTKQEESKKESVEQKRQIQLFGEDIERLVSEICSKEEILAVTRFKVIQIEKRLDNQPQLSLSSIILLRQIASNGINWSLRFFQRVINFAYWISTFQLLENLRTRKIARTVINSGLFDLEFYLLQNPDVAENNMNPLLHYIQFGAAEGRDPHSLFDTSWYLEKNSDVAKDGMNPLLHYIQFGAAEGRDPHSLFDTSWYLEKNSDVAKDGMNPLLHYIQFGAAEGRDPHPLFDTSWYLTHNPDVAITGMNPLIHYVLYGKREGRKPCEVESKAENHVSIHQNEFIYRPESKLDPYAVWCKVNELNDVALDVIMGALENRMGSTPKISAIMPVYNPDIAHLNTAIHSVLNQIYNNWELCIYDDGSTDPALRKHLKYWTSQDTRIRVRFSEENRGISEASNKAVELATGEFLAFLDQDDVLTSDAFAEIAIYCADHPAVDVVYSDDDKIDKNGNRFAPQFKPDWSPTLLLSYMYMSHLFTIRHKLFQSLGGLRVGFEGSQDYDLALRASEKAQLVGHIPRVLYHWRVVTGSTAESGDAKPASFDAGKRAIEDALFRQDIEAKVRHSKWAREAKVGIFSVSFPDYGPSVTIVIPTKNRLALLRNCINSLKRTTYQNYEVLIIDNESDDLKMLAYLKQTPHRVLRINNPIEKFNFSYLLNQAAETTDSSFLLFLNNDTEVRTPQWLSQMVGYAQQPKVGAVGAKLLFPNGTIQHAGVVHGYYRGLAGPAFRNCSLQDHGYLAYTMVAREYSAVTAACMLTPRELFLEMDGFDEDDFAVAYNDVDYCYRLVDKGFRCIYCADAVLTHHEGESRALQDNPIEEFRFRSRYENFKDHWYSPNLTTENERFQIKPYRFDDLLPKNPRIKAVMVTHNLNHEGAPNSQFELTLGLASTNVIDPIVISPFDGPLRSDYEAVGIAVTITESPLAGVFSESAYMDNLKRFVTALRQSGAQVVYANTAQTFWAIDAAYLAGLPSIWNIRESEPWNHYYDSLPISLRHRPYDAFKYPYRVVFVSETTRQGWNALESHHNFTVIPNGLNLQRLKERASQWNRSSSRKSLDLSQEDIMILLVGTVCDRKNQIDLIKATGLLSDKIASKVRIFIVGDRPSQYSEALHVEVQKLPESICKRIDIISETDQPYLFFLAADIAVCTSKIESYPRVILEAMAFGLPIVTTPVYGISEQVSENLNALFYEPGDVDELSDALTQLIEHPKLRKSFANSSRTLFQGLLSYDGMVKQHGRVMREATLSHGVNPHSSK